MVAASAVTRSKANVFIGVKEGREALAVTTAGSSRLGRPSSSSLPVTHLNRLRNFLMAELVGQTYARATCRNPTHDKRIGGSNIRRPCGSVAKPQRAVDFNVACTFERMATVRNTIRSYALESACQDRRMPRAAHAATSLLTASLLEEYVAG